MTKFQVLCAQFLTMIEKKNISCHDTFKNTLCSVVWSNLIYLVMDNIIVQEMGWPGECTLHTVHCTLYTAHCTLYTVHCTLHTVHCTP